MGPHSPAALAAGVASTPFQYRILVPWFVRVLVDLNVVSAGAQQTAFSVLSVLTAVLLVIALRRFVLLFVNERAIASVAALSVHAILPLIYFDSPYTPYDVSSVLLFTLGLIFLYRNAWSPLMVVFTLATFNRETSLLLTLVTVTTGIGRSRPGVLAATAISQLAIWTVVQLALRKLYAANLWLDYGVYEAPYRVNMSALGMLSERAWVALLTWIGLGIAVGLWQRRIADPFLRRLVFTMPLFMIATFLTGFVRELRIYGEVAPIFVTAACVALMNEVERIAVRPGIGVDA